MATRHAQTQVHPLGADAQAIFTSVRAGRDFFDLIEVCTFHACDLSNICRVYLTLSRRTVSHAADSLRYLTSYASLK